MSKKDWISFIFLCVVIACIADIGRMQTAFFMPVCALVLILLPTYIYQVIRGIKKRLDEDERKHDI